MVMDAQTIINVLGMILMGIGGWLFRQLWEAVHMLRAEIKSVENELHKEYVRKEDFQDRFNRVDDNLQRILDKLDNKLDKHHLKDYHTPINER